MAITSPWPDIQRRVGQQTKTKWCIGAQLGSSAVVGFVLRVEGWTLGLPVLASALSQERKVVRPPS